MGHAVLRRWPPQRHNSTLYNRNPEAVGEAVGQSVAEAVGEAVSWTAPCKYTQQELDAAVKRAIYAAEEKVKKIQLELDIVHEDFESLREEYSLLEVHFGDREYEYSEAITRAMKAEKELDTCNDLARKLGAKDK